MTTSTTTRAEIELLLQTPPPIHINHPLIAELDLVGLGADLADLDGTEDEKIADLHLICAIAIAFIDPAFGTGPAAKTCGQVAEPPTDATAPGGALLSSDPTFDTSCQHEGGERSGS